MADLRACGVALALPRSLHHPCWSLLCRKPERWFRTVGFCVHTRADTVMALDVSVSAWFRIEGKYSSKPTDHEVPLFLLGRAACGSPWHWWKLLFNQAVSSQFKHDIDGAGIKNQESASNSQQEPKTASRVKHCVCSLAIFPCCTRNHETLRYC
jgi:hypothetical protein